MMPTQSGILLNRKLISGANISNLTKMAFPNVILIFLIQMGADFNMNLIITRFSNSVNLD